MLCSSLRTKGLPVFLLNPPAPHCIGPCGRCPCVPKYWKMTTDAFTDVDDLGANGQFISPFTGILEYKGIGFSFVGGGGGFPFPIHPDIHFWGLRTRGLKTDETVELNYHDHLLYAPWYLYLHPTTGRWRMTLLLPGISYVDWSKVPRSSHPKPAPEPEDRTFSYFDCLGPNRFYFENSEVASNWPAETFMSGVTRMPLQEQMARRVHPNDGPSVSVRDSANFWNSISSSG